MKRIMMGVTLILLIAFTGTCGPSCYEEAQQEQDCFNLIFVAYVACIGTANAEADATSRLAANTACGNNLTAGMLGCVNQVHPDCYY